MVRGLVLVSPVGDDYLVGAGNGALLADGFAHTAPGAIVAACKNYVALNHNEPVILTDTYTQPAAGTFFAIYFRCRHLLMCSN